MKNPNHLKMAARVSLSPQSPVRQVPSYLKIALGGLLKSAMILIKEIYEIEALPSSLFALFQPQSLSILASNQRHSVVRGG